MTDWKDDYLPCQDGFAPYELEEVLAAFEPGWHELITRAFAAVPEGASIIQVKQKFGGLRIYTAAPDSVDLSAFRALVEELANEAGRICEICGSTTEVRRSRSDRERQPILRNLCATCRGGGEVFDEGVGGCLG